MFGALKPGFRSLATHKLVVNVVANFKPKRTAAASRDFLATVRLSCFFYTVTRLDLESAIWGTLASKRYPLGQKCSVTYRLEVVG